MTAPGRVEPWGTKTGVAVPASGEIGFSEGLTIELFVKDLLEPFFRLINNIV